jgi:hypothetical protein
VSTAIKVVTKGAVGLESVVDVTVFLTDMKGYGSTNDGWNKVLAHRHGADADVRGGCRPAEREAENVEMKLSALLPDDLVGKL